MRRDCCHHIRFALCALATVLPLAGCGTTRSTDTGRTATEQLLISDAIDRSVQTVDFTALAGQTVYLDASKLGTVVDRDYLVSTLRQHLLASGCALREDAASAEFVVEARAGAIGTDRNDLLFGVPSMNVPQFLPGQPTPAAIPEIPLAKRRDQRGIAKISVFAYHRPTGAPVWQSGMMQQESSSNDVWIFGAGPFQRGTIYEGTSFAGRNLGTSDESPGATNSHSPRGNAMPGVALSEARVFNPPTKLAASSQPGEAATSGAEGNIVTGVPHPLPEITSAGPGAPIGVATEARPVIAPYARLFAPPAQAEGSDRTARLPNERLLRPADDFPSGSAVK